MPLTVRFQNFSNNESIRFLWDFGDGSTSDEKSPTHTYLQEGDYTVQLNMVMSTGAQGSVIKTDYIKVSETEVTPFFYAKEISSNTTSHTAVYEFVDQTDGDIKARYWVFGDGISILENDPYIHSIRHTYLAAGVYSPSLLIVFKSDLLKRVFLQDTIVVN
jgi:PKD repeat protein